MKQLKQLVNKYKHYSIFIFNQPMQSDIESFFDDKEEIDEATFYDIIEYGIHVSELYMESYVSNMANYNFDDDFEENIMQMIIEQYGKQYDLYMFHDEDIESDDLYIDVIMEEIKKQVFTHIVPRRGYKKSFIRREPNILRICQQLEILRNKPQPEQRTPAWYETRHNLITASNAWKCFESQSKQNEIIYEKCQPLEEKSNTNNLFVNTNSSLHWGQKYEPLSTQLYEYLYSTQVEDFGCIAHDTHTFLGASPDGIVVKEDCTRYGRMLEIKNIVNREITQIPKKEYWIQMQLQMEVCDLNECDFLETKFVEYENSDAFYADGENYNCTDEILYKGAFLMFMENNVPKYFYPEFHISKEKYEIWETQMLEENTQMHFIKTIYWKLEKYSNILVLRNKKWFESTIEQVRNIWSQVLYERENGYLHRAPNKRERRPTIDLTEETKELSDKPDSENQCFIIDSSDDEKSVDEKPIVLETNKEDEPEQTIELVNAVEEEIPNETKKKEKKEKKNIPTNSFKINTSTLDTTSTEDFIASIVKETK